MRAVEKQETIVVTDRNGDGVPDCLDACPGTLGFTKYNGCLVPDTDGDRIDDDHDSSKTVSGVARDHDCPMTYRDGGSVNGKEDKCTDGLSYHEWQLGCKEAAAAGFGLTRPVTDNKTATRRAFNRREEFKLILKYY